jgi:dolichol-phosphate mannosyltransferase
MTPETTTPKKKVSLVIPCYNEAEVFAPLRRELIALGDRLAARYEVEFLFIDDGSRDDTWNQIVAFARDDRRARGIALSRNFGHQTALSCGYDHADGDAVVCLDADLQDPPAVVPDLVREWENGADIVYAVRRSRAGETGFKLRTADGFYKLFGRLAKTDAPSNVGDFRLLSRRAVAAFRQLPEKRRYLRGMVGWLGFRTATVLYDRAARHAGQTKYSLKKMLNFATDGLLSFSAAPLRLSFLLAFAGLAVTLLCLLYAVLRLLAGGGVPAPGAYGILLAVAAFGVAILACLGIIGEYIGRIYEQVLNRPLYFIRETVGGADRPKD